MDEMFEELLTCTLCGRELGDSDDDQPDWPTGPMCADCYQARELDNDIRASEHLTTLIRLSSDGSSLSDDGHTVVQGGGP